MGCSNYKFLFCTVLIGICVQLCLGNEPELVNEKKPQREGRFIGGLLGLGGPAPLPGDITSPVVCERYCRNRCLNGGYSGYLGVPGCNQFCDCTYYIGGSGGWGRPGFFG